MSDKIHSSRKKKGKRKTQDPDVQSLNRHNSVLPPFSTLLLNCLCFSHLSEESQKLIHVRHFLSFSSFNNNKKNPDGMSDAEGQRAVPADDDAQIVDVTPQPVCRAHPPTHTIFVVLHTHFGSPCTPNRATTLVCKCSPFFPLSFPTHTHGSRLCDTRLQPRQRSPLSTRARGQEAAGPQRRRRRRRRAWTSWSTRTWWWTSLCR